MDRATYIKPEYRTPYQKRIASRFRPIEAPVEDISDFEQRRLARDARRGYEDWANSGRGIGVFGGGLWGYDLEEFRGLNHAILSQNYSYSYIATYFVVAFRYQGGQSQVVLVNGAQYNTVEELLANVEADQPLALRKTGVDGVVVATRVRVISGIPYGQPGYPKAARYPE